MQRTNYLDGSEVIRLGPLAEMQEALLRDLADAKVGFVGITKVTENTMKEIAAKVVRDLEAMD